MKRFSAITLAAIVAATAAASSASATLSDRDGTVLHLNQGVQVADRGGKGGNDGGRNDGGKGRDAHRDRKDDKVIWRYRDKHERPFFLFRGRGDCETRAVKVRDQSGNLVVRNAWVCN
jgi:Spy/CpxP family protein refolding chaperone